MQAHEYAITLIVFRCAILAADKIVDVNRYLIIDRRCKSVPASAPSPPHPSPYRPPPPCVRMFVMCVRVCVGVPGVDLVDDVSEVQLGHNYMGHKDMGHKYIDHIGLYIYII